MSIRLANPTDCRAIQGLLGQLDYPGGESALAARLERMVKDPEEVLLLWEETADDGEMGSAAGEEIAGGAGGRVLGLLSLHFIPQIAVEGDFARISYFAVDEDVRGKGIGMKMEAYAAKLARERGCCLMEVHCHERRARAHAFYYRQGYEESPKYLIKRLI